MKKLFVTSPTRIHIKTKNNKITIPIIGERRFALEKPSFFNKIKPLMIKNKPLKRIRTGMSKIPTIITK